MFVVVGVTGGIAAYKSVQLVRLLVKDGHEVHVVPTEAALRFVGAPTWEAISRHPVTTSVHEDVAQVRHVALGQRADLVVVAPATAHTIARMAAGLADDLLGTTLLATSAPVVIAPAMHTEMWQHPATQANVDTLTSRGIHMVGPVSGELTGGDSGPGRMAEPEDIHAVAVRELSGGSAGAGGQEWFVAAGGTREPLDPVRFLGNRSSGRQGIEVARAAARRGASVTLVAANVGAEVLARVTGEARIRVVQVSTTDELQRAADEHAPRADVVVMAAAVADYRPVEVADAKLTKETADGILRLELVETPDILAGLAADRRPGQTIVGFAAETPRAGESLLDRAAAKLDRKGADLLAANEVGWTRGFERDDNHLLVVGAGATVVADVDGTKRETADALVAAILAHRAG
ncbi:bifunctional phosphopantothenoylcysteine decarboxylase/phosphopantothenate--cysteine ligase CoaBC [Microbacterium excoecariae]|uniref:bifunctional phosphopantothenoylcysteine decarboxylase/phosphopantothenate--cysteine ligase CoaBC n=1 Tax=Microbacterium excoecariae TaxID=2715210 RepID=UPI00140A3D2E|nr:bifunctional phosphopantothenoylcysteine decarboxylase/phosphopantothenate--cysteine ligase CoaBC [Microbacterium excoecariae]NHI16307.1 bifunctional phosphopantothenoylcysteine decarboxylase/phosphopantothenate--cysteine ligase CoaBC [Microbacterium excoecariae]